MHKCWPKTSCAGNHGNYQKFDQSLLPKNQKCIFACFRPCRIACRPYRLSHINALRINLSYWSKDQSPSILPKNIENIFTVWNVFFSGVAAVLELARQFVESHCKPKNTIIFATFDLEEMGGQVRHIFNQLIISVFVTY